MRQIIWMEHTKSKAGRESKKKKKRCEKIVTSWDHAIYCPYTN